MGFYNCFYFLKENNFFPFPFIIEPAVVVVGWSAACIQLYRNFIRLNVDWRQSNFVASDFDGIDDGFFSRLYVLLFRLVWLGVFDIDIEGYLLFISCCDLWFCVSDAATEGPCGWLEWAIYDIVVSAVFSLKKSLNVNFRGSCMRAYT